MAEFKGEILVGDSQVNHGGAYMSLLQSSAWTAIFRVERLQPQDVCAVARRIQRLCFKEAVNFFLWALNIRLLFRMVPRRYGVKLTQIWLLFMKRASCQVLLLDQVEIGHTSLLSAFRFSFHSWL